MDQLTPPQLMMSFVGRDDDVQAVTELLEQPETRLVTLTGPGGVGKTRLALHVANQVKGAFEGGAITVDLSAMTIPELVLPAIARECGVTDTSAESLLSRLAHAIRDREILFFIDNFEQVAAAAVVIADVLAACPNATFLVTSRMPLHIAGEYEYPVDPLDVPAPDADHQPAPEGRALVDYAAVELFVQRARAASRSFDPAPEMLETIGEVTRMLDGLPLAIELAAARVKFLSLPALRSRLTDRLTLLTGGPRDMPDRLRTMRDAIRWSHELLSPEEAVVFRRLSVFSDSFSAAAAQAVAGAAVTDEERAFLGLQRVHLAWADAIPNVAEHIDSLLDKSLLRVAPAPGDDLRFRMMLTVQEYGISQLTSYDERQLMRTRALRYYRGWLQDAAAELHGAEQALWLTRIDQELGNIRQALQTALDSPVAFGEAGVQLAATMWQYWLSRGQPNEGVRWLEQTLACRSSIELSPVIEAKALNCLGNLRLDLGDHIAASGLYRESLAMYRSVGNLEGIGDELNNLGLSQLITGEYEGARDSLEESLAICRRYTEPKNLPWVLSNLGDVAMNLEDYDLAEAYHAEGLAILRSTGNVRRIAFSCHALGCIAWFRNDFDRARAWFDQGLEYQSQLDDTYLLGLIMLGLGRLDLATGNTILAMEHLRRGLEVLQKMGARRIMLDTIDEIASAASRFGFHHEAARLLGTVDASRKDQHIGVAPRVARETDRLIDALTRHLGDEVFRREFVMGQRRLLAQASEDAIALMSRIRERAEAGYPSAAAGEGAFDPAAAYARAQELGLTRRERQVLDQLARGASDKEIAGALSIAPRTAMTHVANILTKLGVNRRTAAASYALREGLVDPAQVEDNALA